MSTRAPSLDVPSLANPKLYGIETSQNDVMKDSTQDALDALWTDENPEYEAFRSVWEARETLGDLKQLVDNLPYEKLVVLGMGASILNPRAVLSAAKTKKKEVIFISHLDENKFEKALQDCEPAQCGFLVISKSGSTLETTALALSARQWIISKGLHVAKHLAIIKGFGDSQLDRLARHDNVEYQFIHPNIGGRFASFTPVTLVPGLFAGLDMNAFLNGASLCLKEAQEQGAQSTVGHAVRFHMLAYNTGRPMHILETFSRAFSPFSKWWCQLWAESLGKNAEAITPIRSSGPFDHHSQWQLYLSSPQNKCVTFIAPHETTLDEPLADPVLSQTIGLPHFSKCGMNGVLEATFHGAKTALTQHGVPYAVWKMNVENARIHDVGYLMMHTILTVLSVGRMLQCNPFGQPAVESLKIAARDFMSSQYIKN